MMFPTNKKIALKLAPPQENVSCSEFLRCHAAFAFTMAAMASFLLCLAIIPIHQITGAARFVSEVVRQYQYTPNNDQLDAHALTLLAVAAFSAIVFLLARRGLLGLSDAHFAWRPGVKTIGAFFIVGLAIYSFWEPSWLIAWTATAFLLLGFFVIAGPFLSSGTINAVIAGLIGAYLAILVVPGFFVRPIALMSADPDALSQFELHLLYLTMPGHAIASGLNFFAQLPPGYGLLSPSLLSVIDRFHHGMTLGNQLRFVQVWQLFFALTAIAAYFSFRPHHLLGIFLAILFAGPYWATAGLGIWHPNQTGLRSIGLPIGILAIAIAGRLKLTRAAVWLGAVAAVVLLSNLETSIAISAGFVVYLLLRSGQIPIRLTIYAIGGFVAAIMAYGLLYRISLGRLPMALNLSDLSGFAGQFSRVAQGGDGLRLFDPGFEKENLFIVPLALIMFGHAIYIVIASFMKLGHRRLTQREAMRASIATILLVWLAYYFNAPNWWQIWTHLFLYGFLIIDVMDRRLFGIGFPSSARLGVAERLESMRVAPTRLILLFLLGLMIVHTNRNLLRFSVGFMYPDWVASQHEGSVISGILLPRDMADQLTAKAKKLVELNAASGGNLVYLTFNVSFMPELTGLFEVGPERDLWVEIPGDNAFDATIMSILKRHPEVVLIDAPTGPLAVTGERKAFQDRVRAAVSREYRLSTTEDGWQIWRPI